MKEISTTLYIAEINSVKLKKSSRATKCDKSVCMLAGFGWDAVNFSVSTCSGLLKVLIKELEKETSLRDDEVY